MAHETITFKAADGHCPAVLVRPQGPHAGAPGIILYMDAFGPRPALVEIAERLAGQGYVVLVPDLFYRSGPYGPFEPKTAFAEEETARQLRALMAATTHAKTEADGAYFIAALRAAGATGPIGTVGYCMGGGRALIAAAAYPDDVAAAASFHGGNLAKEAPDSPHTRAGTIRGRVYVACAGVDGSFPPEQSARLAQALREAEVDHTIENYVRMKHGWAVPDSRVHDPAGAARHMTRLLTFFSETLGPGAIRS